MAAALIAGDEESNGPENKIGTKAWLRDKVHYMKLLKNTFYDKKIERLSDHFIKFDKLVNELYCIGMAFDDSDMVCHLLLTLPQHFEPIVLDYCDDGIPSMEIIQARLLLEQNKRERSTRDRSFSKEKKAERIAFLMENQRRVRSVIAKTDFDGSALEHVKKFEQKPEISHQPRRDVPIVVQIDDVKIKTEPCNDEDMLRGYGEQDPFDGDEDLEKPLPSALDFLKLECDPPYQDTKKSKRHKKRKKKRAEDLSDCPETEEGKKRRKKRKRDEDMSGKIYSCDFCDKRYKSKQRLINHVRAHCEEYECQFCGQCFNSSPDLKEHKKSAHTSPTEPCKICNKLIKTKALVAHLKCHETNDRYLCTVCGKDYKTATGLQAHMDLGHPQDNESLMVACEICGKMMRKMSVKTHMVLHKDKKFLCTLCGQNFHWRSSLLTHMQSHGQVLPFACSMCARQCVSKSQLDRHMTRHTGTKPFWCDMCDKSFTENTSLKRHKEVSHGIGDTQTFPCEVCGKMFKVKYNLKVHMRTHTLGDSQACGICQKVFKSAEMSCHLKTHTGEASFECTTCALGFNSMKALNTHFNSQNHLNNTEPERGGRSAFPLNLVSLSSMQMSAGQ